MRAAFLRPRLAAEARHEGSSYQGIPLVIEWRKGSTREGTDKSGKKWTRKMNADYGFIPGLVTTKGDEEELDVYVGPDPDAPTAYFVEQLKDDGSFDEFKCVLGTDSKTEALELYLSHYPKGWEDHIGSVQWLPMTHLRDIAEAGGVQGDEL